MVFFLLAQNTVFEVRGKKPDNLFQDLDQQKKLKVVLVNSSAVASTSQKIAQTITSTMASDLEIIKNKTYLNTRKNIYPRLQFQNLSKDHIQACKELFNYQNYKIGYKNQCLEPSNNNSCSRVDEIELSYVKYCFVLLSQENNLQLNSGQDYLVQNNKDKCLSQGGLAADFNSCTRYLDLKKEADKKNQTMLSQQELETKVVAGAQNLINTKLVDSEKFTVDDARKSHNTMITLQTGAAGTRASFYGEIIFRHQQLQKHYLTAEKEREKCQKSIGIKKRQGSLCDSFIEFEGVFFPNKYLFDDLKSSKQKYMGAAVKEGFNIAILLATWQKRPKEEKKESPPTLNVDPPPVEEKKEETSLIPNVGVSSPPAGPGGGSSGGGAAPPAGGSGDRGAPPKEEPVNVRSVAEGSYSGASGGDRGSPFQGNSINNDSEYKDEIGIVEERDLASAGDVQISGAETNLFIRISKRYKALEKQGSFSK